MPRSNAGKYTTMEIGGSRIILGCVAAIYVEDGFMDPAGRYIMADTLHSIGRVSRLGKFVSTPKARCPAPNHASSILFLVACISSMKLFTITSTMAGVMKFII